MNKPVTRVLEFKFSMRGTGRYRDLLLTPSIVCPRCEGQEYDQASCGSCDNTGRIYLTTEREIIPYEDWSTELWALLAGELNRQADLAQGPRRRR